MHFQRSLIRIVKGPAGGFLASLGIAAVLGGVALATPSQPIADLASHRPDVIAAAPLGSDPLPVGTGTVVSTGGLQTDADPPGRAPALDDPSAPGAGHGSTGEPRQPTPGPSTGAN